MLLLIVVMSMVNNLEHVVSVYTSLIEGTSQTQAYSVVLAFDLFVIALIIYGKEQEALIIAITIFVINIIYYNVLGHVMNGNLDAKNINTLAASIIFSGLFSFAIHRSAVLIKEEQEDNSKLKANDAAKGEANRLEIKKLQDELTPLKEYKTKMVESLTCICGTEYSDHKKLGGHQSKCTEFKSYKVIPLGNC